MARQDLDYFDLILAMDKSNLDNLRRLATEQQRESNCSCHYAGTLMTTTRCRSYYGLGHGFDLVLDMVEDASLAIEEKKKKAMAN